MSQLCAFDKNKLTPNKCFSQVDWVEDYYTGEKKFGGEHHMIPVKLLKVILDKYQDDEYIRLTAYAPISFDILKPTGNEHQGSFNGRPPFDTFIEFEKVEDIKETLNAC